MANFSAYGMAGIGVAAAVGFVFALSFLGNTSTFNTNESQGLNALQQQEKSQPSDNQDMAARMEAGENQTPARQENLMAQKADLGPALSSITALDENRELIGRVEPEMQFALQKPVYIHASFVNNNESAASNYFISMGISSGNAQDNSAPERGQSTEELANFRGDISAKGTVELELYWDPQRTGDYTLIVFSMTQDGPASAQVPEPVASIPLRVIG